ncbi:hypothetical protein A6A27_32400 [Micromonospora sp. CB01531]|nr:hypothetical protein A6A27_32400 [Micromonospora sp. CB01531]
MAFGDPALAVRGRPIPVSRQDRQRRDFTFVPNTDGPILPCAPVWRSAGHTALVRAFVQAARDAT